MEIARIIPIILVTLLLFFTGCVGKTPVGTPVPTTTVATTETPQQTTVPTVPAHTPPLTPSLTPVQHTQYIVWIDSDYGFYKVRAVRDSAPLNLPSDFNILNFSIYVGDKVRWMNDDSYDFPLTLVSKEGLWSGRAGLMRYQGERVVYTFNKTGTYTFYIEEYPRLPQQKITVVNP